MKASKILSLIAGAALLGSATSCMKNDDKNDIVTTQALTSYFNVCSTDRQQVMLPNVSYNVVYNYTQTAATITMNGIKVPGMDSPYPTLTLPPLGFTESVVGWKYITMPQVTASNSSLSTAPTLMNFTFNLADRYVNTLYSPAENISYKIGEWDIHSFPTTFLAQGSTVVRCGDSEFRPTEDAEAIYSINYDPEKATCEISIVGAQFALAMPAQNMRFKAIPFCGDGASLVASAAGPFTPMIVSSTGAETPQPGFPISNLMCIYNATTGLYVRFDCTIGQNVYRVVMNDTYPTSAGM